MHQVKETAVFRICAGAAETWNVFQDPSEEPVACFNDKTSALTFATCLARGKVSWYQLLNGSGPLTRAADKPAPRA
jgi:hypothetical protein